MIFSSKILKSNEKIIAAFETIDLVDRVKKLKEAMSIVEEEKKDEVKRYPSRSTEIYGWRGTDEGDINHEASEAYSD